MKKCTGKILSILLVACMMTTLFPMTAGASLGDTTADTAWYSANPEQAAFTVSSAAELAGLASLVNGGTDFSGKTVSLAGDIALNDTSDWTAWDTTAPADTWTPIGNSSHAFRGTFDGGSHTVSGIYIDSGSSYAGLFGYVSGGTITNLKIAKSFIGGRNKVGGVAGCIDAGSTVSNCSSAVNTAGTGNYIGGVVGYAGGGGTLTNNYYLSGSAASGIGSGSGAAQAKTMDEMKSASFVVAMGAAFVQDLLLLNDGYPLHSWEGGSLDFVGGDGSADSPYLIETDLQLRYMAYLVNHDNATYGSAAYKLISDIDLDAYWTVSEGTAALTSGTVWTPIGVRDEDDDANSKPFSGAFDGSGCVIYGLYINDSSASFQGLFGYVNGGAVDNVGLMDSYVNAGGSCVGGIVGYAQNSAITRAYNTGTVSGAGKVGGVAGGLEASSLTNCYNMGAVSASGSCAGGVAGGLEASSLTNCYNMGAVSASGSCAGGVAGEVKDTSSLTNCYNTGAVSALAGGGGVTGQADASTMTNCYYLTGTAASGLGEGTGNATAKTAEEMQGADFATTLGVAFLQDNFSQNGGYPLLDCGFAGGSGTEADPYLIETASQLRNMAYLVRDDNADYGSAYYSLTRDIDVLTKWTLGSDNTLTLVRGRMWYPIGYWWCSHSASANNYGYPFSGVFDGGNHTVSGIYINYTFSYRDYRGLFGAVKGGTVKNVGVTDSVIQTNELCTGAVAGLLFAGGTVDNCYSSARIIKEYVYSYVGGIVGSVGYRYVSDLLVTDGGNVVSNCHNTGTISSISGDLGGVVGVANSGISSDPLAPFYPNTITDCSNTGVVSAAQGGYVSGILSSAGSGGAKTYVTNCTNSGTIASTSPTYSAYSFGISKGGENAVFSNCSNTGAVANNSSAGGQAAGIAGYADLIDGCYNSGPITSSGQASGISAGMSDITNCHNSGSVTSLASFAGGIMAQQNGMVERYISDCSNTGTIISGSYCAGGILGGDYDQIGGTTITNCYNAGSVSGGSNAGGIGGYGRISLYNCYNTGSVSAAIAGGLLGTLLSGRTVTSCYNTGSVGAAIAGGLLGTLLSGRTVTSCYNTGSVSGTSGVGGLVGNVRGGTLSNSYNTGAVTGTSAVGGVAGSVSSAAVTNCYYLNTAAAAGIGSGSGGATAKLAGQLKSGETAHLLQGSQAETVWGHTKLSGTELPKLAVFDTAVNKVIRIGFYDDTNGDGDQDLLSYSYALYGGTATFPAVYEAGIALTWVNTAKTAYPESSTFTEDISLFLTRNGEVSPPTPSLVSITAPAAITGVANGTAKTAEALGLPATVTLVTDYDSVSASVTWDVSSSAYDPSDTAEQTFTVAGTVALPSGVDNTSGVSLTITISVTVSAAPSYEPVTNITGVPTAATAGADLTLTGTVAPADATNKTIVWSVQSAGATGATVSGNTLSTTAAGTVTVRATVTNGTTESSDYIQDFDITVSAAATTYTLTLSAGTGGRITTGSGGSYAAGASISLTATANANYQFNGWSSSGGGSFSSTTSASATFVMPANATIVTASFTYTGGGNNGGTSSEPAYKAVVRENGSAGTRLSMTVDTDSGSAAAEVTQAAGLANGGLTVITVPSIPDVDTYILNIPAASLSVSGGTGALTFETDAGSVTLPANMLAGLAAAESGTASISIGQGDPASLTDAERAAIGNRPLIQLTLKQDGKQTAWNNPDAPVTVSIPYTPTAAELKNPDSIVIWYIDGSGNAVSVPNGHYDAAAGTVTFTTTHFSLYAVGYNPVSFGDVADTAWYHNAVSFLAARGITGGTSKDTFSPDATLTRGQFIVMLLRAYGISPDEASADNFTDAGNTYCTGYLAAAKRLGISGGIGSNLFAPDKEITRQEMFTLLYNALKTIGQLPKGASGKTLSDFSDSESLASWAKDAMALLVETGIVTGSGGKLSPTETATRAEMAQLLYQLLGK